MSAPADPTAAGEKLKTLVGEIAARPLKAGLYIVATPIGNLSDISARALAVLIRADAVYCEDTRHSLRLFSAFGIKRALHSYHDHSTPEDRARIVRRLENSESVALISDAGTPLLSDPGYKLARDAAEGGHAIFPVPGPVAAVAALTASGLPCDRFFFEGFLPVKLEARRRRLAELCDVPGTLLFYESPNRVGRTLTDMSTVFHGREAAVVREISKIFEEVIRGTFPALADDERVKALKGEIVIVVGPPLKTPTEVTDAQIGDALRKAGANRTRREAVEKVAKELGTKRKRVYDLANKISD